MNLKVFAKGDIVQPATNKLRPFTGTVLDVSKNLQIVIVRIEESGTHCFDADDLKGETDDNK